VNLSESDQLTAFVEATANIPPAPDTGPDGQDLPRIPFPTAYTLTRAQETKLIEHALRRLTELKDEMGRSCIEQGEWYTQADFTEAGKRSFLGKRQLYDMLYHNIADWRPHVLGGIFEDSNLVVPLARRIVRQMVARANGYFFATDPWFAAFAVGVADRDLAADIERYARFKFDESHLKHALELAVELAFVRGEAVVKTTYETREQIYRQRANVLVDADGRDILGADGDYILDSDLWATETMPNEAVPTGRVVLKRDGVTPKPLDPTWENKLVTRKITHFRGAEAGVVYYKDFLCPLAAPSVQDADCVVHLYDMPVMRLADMYQRKSMLDLSNEQSVLATQRAIEMIRNMAGESGEPKAARDQERPEHRQNEQSAGERSEPVVEIAEFHLRYDADGDGIMEDVMLVLDVKNQAPIFYDYEANVTPDGLRPFDVVKVNQVDGRWYGMGGMEMFESSQEIVDLLVNRWNFSQSRAGRVDFWNPQHTLEGDANPNLLLNWGSTYTPKPGKTKDDILSYVTLPDMKHEALQNMFEFFMQMATNESGVANANDANAVGLDTAELATGVRNIEKSGQEMFALYLSHLEPGLQSVIQRAAALIFANLDAEEVFTFFEGDTQIEGSIRPDDVREMNLHVSLLLTRYRGEQLLQSSAQAANLVTQYYGLAPVVQARVAPLYRDMLKALQVNFADEIIAPMDAMPTTAPPVQADPRAAQPMPTGRVEPNI
jgi:hypothetical protein